MAAGFTCNFILEDPHFGRMSEALRFRLMTLVAVSEKYPEYGGVVPVLPELAWVLRLTDHTELQEQLEALAERGFLTEWEDDSGMPRYILTNADRKLGAPLDKADRLQRRYEFNLSRNDLMAWVAARDGASCVACGKTNNLSLDHKIPLSRGGSDDPDNLQILCRSCNSSKGAK